MLLVKSANLFIAGGDGSGCTLKWTFWYYPIICITCEMSSRNISSRLKEDKSLLAALRSVKFEVKMRDKFTHLCCVFVVQFVWERFSLQTVVL